MFEFYQLKNLQILKHTITVTGLVLKSLFSCLGTRDKTRIRVYKLWKRIWKADANALSLGALSQPV